MLPARGPVPDADGRPNLSAMLAARGPPPLPRPAMGAILGTSEPQPQDGADAPPPNPFGKGGLPPRGLPLSGGLSGGLGGGRGGGLSGGLSGGLGGGLPKPKKPTPQPLGVNVPSDAEGRALTPTARLRGLDALRMHEPLAAEREKLKLPGGDRDRLSVGPDLKTLLLFCGAARGVRFATVELLELKTLAASAEVAYARMDASYKQLSAAARKRKGPPPPWSASEDVEKKPLDAETTGGAGKSKEEEEGKVSVTSGLDMESYTAPSAAQVLASLDGGSDGGAAPVPDAGGDNAESEDPVVAEVVAFHATADAYCAAFRALASDFVGRKQKEVPEGGGEIVVDKDHGEGLKDAKPFPQYLQALLDKYKAAAGPGGGASKSGGVIDSLGAFATFLGCCLFLHQPITPAELDALEVLVLASDDGSGANLESLPCFRANSHLNQEPSSGEREATEGERNAVAVAAAAAAESSAQTSEEANLPSPPSSSSAPKPVPPAPVNVPPASINVPSSSDSQESPSGAEATVATEPLASTATTAEGKEEEEAAAPGARKAIERPLKFWVKRVWVFLTKVRELKSVPKDGKVLCDAALVARWLA